MGLQIVRILKICIFVKSLLPTFTHELDFFQMALRLAIVASTPAALVNGI